MAEAIPTPAEQAPSAAALQKVDTPDVKTIEELARCLSIAPASSVKTLIVKGKEDGSLVALILRGDHQLNTVKAERLGNVAVPLQMADEEHVRAACGAGFGSLGPAGLQLPMVVDLSAAQLASFTCGANSDDAHLTGVKWDRDCPPHAVADLRNVVSGDPSPDGTGHLEIMRGIEVGHIFQLGTKYSESMNAQVLNENGKSVTVSMGCYGIGVSRIVAAAIEQNHDDNGIIWPDSMAPFQLAIVPLNMHKSEDVARCANTLYQQLQAVGIEVLLDDRNERPGVKFADMELIGIPHRIVIADRALADGNIEYKSRRAAASEFVAKDDILNVLRERIH